MNYELSQELDQSDARLNRFKRERQDLSDEVTRLAELNIVLELSVEKAQEKARKREERLY